MSIKNSFRLKKKIALTIIICILLVCFYRSRNVDYVEYEMKNDLIKFNNGPDNMKYILQWTFQNEPLYPYFGQGQKTFMLNQCKFQNCYDTYDKKYFKDIRQFDVIVFHGPDLFRSHHLPHVFPKVRSPRQKYVFASIESAHNYPVCDEKFDRYFNWTWTYKLNSDGPFGYITIRNKTTNEIIGPKTDMHWMDVKDMKPISEEMKIKLSRKNKDALWVVSNCHTKSKREELMIKIIKELSKYNFKVDILGACGEKQCGEDCFQKLQKDYCFFFAFENSFSEDYVTEKLIHALKHDTIPIVFGGANYTRFMPKGIYLDAKELTPKELAKQIYLIMQDKEIFYSYFKWQNHYKFQTREETTDSSDNCKFCEMINNPMLVHHTSVYENMKDWWTPPGVC